MSKYEFSLQQEVLLEKGAAVLGDLFRYELINGISMQQDPITVMHDLVWSAKRGCSARQIRNRSCPDRSTV